VNAARRFALASLFAIASLLPSFVPAARAADADLPVPPLRFPAPVSRTLPNGLRVVVFPTSRQPLVHVQLQVAAGSVQEADSLPGLAALTAELIRHGTTSRSPEQFGSELGRAGATFSTWSGRDFALVVSAARPQSLESALELMSDAVLNPSFGGDNFASDLQAWSVKLDGQRQNLADLADQRVADAAFAPHPYAHAASSDLVALGTYTQANVQAFHRDHWRPDRAVLVLAGDLTPERAFALATDWFGGWNGRALSDRVRPEPRQPAGARVVDVPRAPRVEIRVAVRGPGIAQPGYYSWSLAQAALESAVLPAGTRVAFVSARDASLIVLASATPLDQAAAQAQRMTGALRAFADAPPTGAALDAVRRRVARRYPLGLETLGAFAGQWQTQDFAGLPPDDVARTGEHIAAADLAASLPLLAAKPVVVLVGPGESLRAPLAPLGPVEVVAPDVPRAVRPDTLPAPTAEQSRRAGTVLAAAVAAHGGAAAIKAAHVVVYEGEVTVFRDGQQIPALFSNVHVDPDRMSTANKLLKMESRQVMVGDKGWTSMQADSAVAAMLDSAGVMGIRVAFHSDLVHELRAAIAPGARAAWRGTELVGEKKCDLVDFRGPIGWQRLAIDVVTHQVMAIDSELSPGPVWRVRRVLGDYRRVNGLLLPFVENHLVEGTVDSHVLVRRAAVNQPVDMHLFNPPLDLMR
jgi:zinc protease